MLAAEFGTGEVFWSILFFFAFFIWVMLLFQVFGDIFRSPELSGVSKALWSLFVIALPYLGVFAYLVVHGDRMQEHAVAQAAARDAAALDYSRSVQANPSTSDELSKLAALRANGTIDDAEFDAAKASLLRA